MPISPEKEKALAAAMSQIDRRFGKGSIMKMGETTSRLAIETIPTGAVALDIALGVGGIPRGRVTEIYGPESSGKTTVVQHIIAEAQRTGGVAALIDAEHALDPAYARLCGVQVDELFVSQPDTGEQPLEDGSDLHQSAPREGRGDVRQPRDHARRSGPEVLLLGPPRHQPHRLD